MTNLLMLASGVAMSLASVAHASLPNNKPLANCLGTLTASEELAQRYDGSLKLEALNLTLSNVEGCNYYQLIIGESPSTGQVVTVLGNQIMINNSVANEMYQVGRDAYTGKKVFGVNVRIPRSELKFGSVDTFGKKEKLWLVIGSVKNPSVLDVEEITLKKKTIFE